MVIRAEARERIAAYRKEAVAETETALEGKKLDVERVRENREDEKRLERRRLAEETRRLLKVNGAEKFNDYKKAPSAKMSKGEEELFNQLEASLQTHDEHHI
jgi:hypothetical protein